MNNRYKKALKKIKKAKKILLVTHAKPDGDAISSICAMMHILDTLGKDYLAYCKDPAPEQLLFLPKTEQIVNNKESFKFADFDLIISLDCGQIARTNLLDEIINRNGHQKFIEIDHHEKIENLADIEIRISGTSSTAEVVYNFIKANKIKINKKIANCILTGILTDTSNFLYPSTTDKTIQIASEMLLYGAKYPQITEETYRNKSFGAMKLWGKAISNNDINKN